VTVAANAAVLPSSETAKTAAIVDFKANGDFHVYLVIRMSPFREMVSR
jgi:hypothetical protein